MRSRWLKMAALVFFGVLVIVLTVGANCYPPPWMT